jgi:pimeloyl-ACP methyl ester carboxylesterase
MIAPKVQYAKSGEVHIAFQLFGTGDLNLVLVPGWTSNLDLWWDNPHAAAWLRRMGEYAKIVIFDKRGTGLSDPTGNAPAMDHRMDDIRAVMDAAGFGSAAVLGWSEGGTLSALFAASHPERCQALVLLEAFARFRSWFPTDEALERFFRYVETKWGTGESFTNFSPSMAGDRSYQAWWARRERSSASPATAVKLMKLNSIIDVSGILPSVNVPTLVVHRTGDAVVGVDGGRDLAALIPGAEMFEIEGEDHAPWTGDGLDAIAAKVQEFLTGTSPAPAIDRVLATILFTDIAGSTARTEMMGDRNWKRLLNTHNELVRAELLTFGGREIKTTGDGFLAIFDRPARAVHAALGIIGNTKAIGVDVRAGVHIGEVQLEGGDISGIAVNLAARTMEKANPGDCLVTRTVKDLVAGSDLTFKERGSFALKGISEQMPLFSASG